MASKTGQMKISALAGRPAPKEMLVDVARLEEEYFDRRPDIRDPDQMVSFGTSGHRGSFAAHCSRAVLGHGSFCECIAAR